MNARLLRSMLMGNSIFSLACASAMLLMPGRVSGAIGWEGPDVWTPLGLLLGLFAIGLGVIAIMSRPPALAAIAASIGDILWVIGTVALALLMPPIMNTTGWLIATSIAAMVLIFGLGQVIGIDRMYRAAGRGHQLDLEFAVSSTRDEFWPLLADLSRISEFADGLADSRVTKAAPAMIGTTRVCTNNQGDKWTESVTSWRPGTGFDLKFDADAPGFPFPFTDMIGGWNLTNDGPNLRVGIYWVVVLKRPVLAPLSLPLMEWKVRQDMAKTVAAIDQMANSETPQARHPIAPAA